MKQHERWVVSCALLWLSACSTLPRPVGPDDDVRERAAVLTRWIGVTQWTDRSCPVPGTAGWSVRPLFPLHGLDEDLKKSARKAKLERFCVYEYRGASPVLRDKAEELLSGLGLRSFEPDRVALAGSALEDATWESFHERFAKQVDLQEDLPVEGTSRVRLAFLDTQPDGPGLPRAGASSAHGYSLMHIAGNLAGPLICRDGGSCPIEVASTLALPVTGFVPMGEEEKRDASRGGFRGSFEDLSRALWSEITRWKEMPADRRTRHLVLNLSVGWDGEKYGGWEDQEADMTPAVQGVYRALKAAADQGILVIAAAGNERGGPQPEGYMDQPLLPGGWEKPVRLSRKGEWIWNKPGEPLLYAASGIDGKGHPLVSTREKGEAPRVAYADHVVVPDLHEPDSRRTATLTGTSVAAAVVSTIASAVWSYQPELTPGEVMEMLDRSGERLPRKHDFSLPPAGPFVRDVQRITLCRALSEAWSTSTITRPSLDCRTEPPKINFDPVEGTEVVSAPARRPFPASVHVDLRDDPWIRSQPAVDPCPSCVVDPPRWSATSPAEIAVVASTLPLLVERTTAPSAYRRLLIEIPNDWTEGDLQGATLEIFDFDERGRKRPLSGHSFDTSSLLTSRATTLEVFFYEPAESFQARLSFVIAPPPLGTPPRSIVTPLFVND